MNIESFITKLISDNDIFNANIKDQYFTHFEMVKVDMPENNKPYYQRFNKLHQPCAVFSNAYDHMNACREIEELIMTMCKNGATETELLQAISHWMVLINAYTYALDYKLSEHDNDIDIYRVKYRKKQ